MPTDRRSGNRNVPHVGKQIETYILVGKAFPKDEIDQYIKEWGAISLSLKKYKDSEIEFFPIPELEPDSVVTDFFVNSPPFKIYALGSGSGFVEFKIDNMVKIPIGIFILKDEGTKVTIKDDHINSLNVAGDILNNRFNIEPELFAIQKIEK